MEQDLEKTFHIVTDDVTSEEKPAMLEQGPFAPPTSIQILERDASTGIPLDVEQTMTKLVLKALTSQQKGVDNCLSADPESLIERVVKKVVWSPQTTSEVTEAVINSPGFIATTAGLSKSEQRQCTDKRENIEERYRQPIEAGIKLDPTAASNLSNIGKKPLTNISNNVKTNMSAYSMETSQSSSDYCNRINAQTAHVDKY